MASAWRSTPEGVQTRLDPGEAAELRALFGDLRELLVSSDRTDDVVARLYPDGHRDDPALAAELRSLIEDDLREGKLAAVRAVLDSLTGEDVVVRLDVATAEQWLTALNDLRLAWGTRIGITEDEADELAEDDPLTGAYDLYHWLTFLQGTLVEALSATG